VRYLPLAGDGMKRIAIILCLMLGCLVIVEGAFRQNVASTRSNISSRQNFPNPFRAIKRWYQRARGTYVPYCPNYFADVTNLTLDRPELIADGKDIANQVKIFTEYHDPENDVVTFNYTVSAGKIIGQGAKVAWDLTGIAPGIYTITAGVNDGCGICGKTQTRRVEVLACDTCRLRETD
jgi:hypothetical protein